MGTKYVSPRTVSSATHSTRVAGRPGRVGPYPDLAHLPIIVLAATTTPGLAEELSYVVQEWLIKSTLSMRDLVETIRRHLPPPSGPGEIRTQPSVR